MSELRPGVGVELRPRARERLPRPGDAGAAVARPDRRERRLAPARRLIHRSRIDR